MIDKIFNENYFKSLNEFIKSDYNKTIREYEIIFYNDVEVNYVVSLKGDFLLFFQTERDRKTSEEILELKSLNYCKAKIAINLKSVFDTRPTSSYASKFFVETYDETLELLDKYCDPKYYSTSGNSVGKVNFKKYDDDSLDIYYLNHRLEKKYFQSRINSEFKYYSLCSAIVYLEEIMNNIHSYQDIFEVNLTQDEIDDVIKV